jgi:hypothetical protein
MTGKSLKAKLSRSLTHSLLIVLFRESGLTVGIANWEKETFIVRVVY